MGQHVGAQAKPMPREPEDGWPRDGPKSIRHILLKGQRDDSNSTRTLKKKMFMFERQAALKKKLIKTGSREEVNWPRAQGRLLDDVRGTGEEHVWDLRRDAEGDEGGCRIRRFFRMRRW